MNIKQDKIKLNFNTKKLMALIFGGGMGGDSGKLRQFTTFITVGMWILAIGIGTIYYLLNDNVIFLETIVVSIMISSFVAIALVLIALLAFSDFNKTYGWGLWFRALIYNIVVAAVCFTINNHAKSDEKREQVKSFELTTTNISKCNYKIKMKSETLSLEYCSNISDIYKRISKEPGITVYLVGNVGYGSNIADHYEILDKKIVRN